MNPRRSYHTQLKSFARQGILTTDILCLIPRSNLHRWRNESSDKYLVFGVVCDPQEQETLQVFSKSRIAKRIFASYVRIIKAVIQFAHGVSQFRTVIKENRTVIVKTINRVKSTIGMKRALQFFDISISTFRQWSLQSQTACFESLTGLCNRIYPAQLSRPEIAKLKGLLVNTQFQYWPVSSIALHALRNNLLPLSLNTWYKYVHKLGISRPRPASRRKKNAISIRATRPNQLWHADITEFVTADQVRHYIYLVVDNFSRKILAWTVADRVSAEIRRSTLEDALNKTRLGFRSITLLTDGGPENLSAVRNLSKVQRSRLVHLTARVDVLYSNSLIEAHNKILKYNYLYRMSIPDGLHLKKLIPEIVDDFNNRPHISLDGLTPNEAEQNIVLDKASHIKFIHSAREVRKAYNQNNRCGVCKE